MKHKFLLASMMLLFNLTLSAETYSGSCGKYMQWDLRDNILIISGGGDMADYAYAEDVPWYQYRKSITTVIIGDNVTSIGKAAFWACENLTSIVIGKSVTHINDYAFYDCASLTSVIIPNSVTYIGHAAFNNCCRNLTSVSIPKTVKYIGEGAFSDCRKLTSIDVEADNPYYCSVDGVLFIKNKSILMQYPAGKSNTSYTIPNCVTIVGESAFDGCIRLADIVIPNGITSISDFAFDSCIRLTSIKIPTSVSSIGAGAFRDCRSLTSITCEAIIPPAMGYLKIINDGAFSLVDKTIPLYVPAQSVNAYKTADQWKEFTNILPIPITIEWKNIDGTILETDKEVPYGLIPEYNSVTPTKSADAQYSYIFTGWTPAITEATISEIYTATYSAKLNQYTIAFKNEDGTILERRQLNYGEIPECEEPVKPSDAQYTYIFTGWDKEVVAVTENATYTAVFEKNIKKYQIIWQDEKENIIKTDLVTYGTTPAFTGTTPTKEGYTFAGWLPNIKPATEDTKYTTYFIPTQQTESKVYTVNINGENCSLNINNQYPEGTVITLEAVADECFEFQQWSDGNKDNPRTVTVTANTNLTAEFNKVRYTITDKTEPGTGGKIQIVGQ